MAKKVTKAPAQKPAAKKAEVSAKAPMLPPRPVPAHQQFLGKGGVKPQHMNKARIIRHQGR